jgi:hypothetical protein
MPESGSSGRSAQPLAVLQPLSSRAAVPAWAAAVPLKLANNMPTEALAGKIVIDTDNYMIWRDGHYPMIEAGEKAA